MKTVSSYFPHRVPTVAEMEWLRDRLGSDPESQSLKMHLNIKINKHLRPAKEGHDLHRSSR